MYDEKTEFLDWTSPAYTNQSNRINDQNSFCSLVKLGNNFGNDQEWIVKKNQSSNFYY